MVFSIGKDRILCAKRVSSTKRKISKQDTYLDVVHDNLGAFIIGRGNGTGSGGC